MLGEITRYHVVYKKVNLTMADGQQAVNVACFFFFFFFFHSSVNASNLDIDGSSRSMTASITLIKKRGGGGEEIFQSDKKYHSSYFKFSNDHVTKPEWH